MSSPEESVSSSSTPNPLNINSSRPVVINFRELKRELKDVEKLNKENLDIKSWESDLRLWIKYQNVTSAETIYTACILTSTGEIREIIQDMLNSDDDDDDDDDDYDDDDEEDNENDNNVHYPSLEKIVNTIEVFYGLKEDQNVLLRDIRALKITKNERVKDFNIRYRSLYLKLDKKRKRQISVLDYADSLINNREAWKKVSLKDNISLKKAFSIAEKVDRLSTRGNIDILEKPSPTSNNFYRNSHLPQYKRKYDQREERKSVDADMEDLTRKMKRLTIKACFFCKEKGHIQTNCPKLQAIIENNRKEIFRQNNLNH